MAKKNVHELLADYTALLNGHGADSGQAQRFLDRHKNNSRFVKLANTARLLKKALTAKQG